MLRAGALRLIRITYARYVVASAVALAADFGLFLILLGAHLPPTIASGSGYAGGVLVHWLLSSRAVFAGSLADDDRARRQQALWFIVSALIGLGTTMAIVGSGSALGLDPRAAKLVAVALSFQLVWLLRRHWVFAP